jgi:hypothetical protein
MRAERTGGVVWGGEDNGIGPRECFFDRLGGLCVGSFGIAHIIDDVVPLGPKRLPKGLATLPAPITATRMILVLSTPTLSLISGESA